MSEPVPCPNCQALLRLPAGATVVRCPGCKAVLEIEPIDEPPPLAPPRATAIPLPFGRPSRPAPAFAPPARPARGKAVKARVVPEAADDPYTRAESAEMLGEEEREREIRRQLRELEAEQGRADERHETLDGECRKAQTGLKLLGVSALLSTIAAVASTFFIVGALSSAPLTPLLALAGLLLLAHWLTAALGFGFCLAGPRAMRGTAGIGVAFTFGHALFNALAAAVFVAPSIGVDMLADRDRADTFLYANLLTGNATCNLTFLADLPYYLIVPSAIKPGVFALLILAAGFEFAKLSTIGLIANQYATAGKDPELAHAAMRFVYRIFAVVFLAPIAKAALTLLVPTDILWIPMLLGTVGYYLWWAFAWFAQYQVLMDAQEIVTANRFTDKRLRYEVA